MPTFGNERLAQALRLRRLIMDARVKPAHDAEMTAQKNGPLAGPCVHKVEDFTPPFIP